MKICHFSDLHAQQLNLDLGVDLYVCTGDMLPNFELLQIEVETVRGTVRMSWDPFYQSSLPERAYVVDRTINPEREIYRQTEWIRKNPGREFLGIPEDAQVIVIPGNHDFIPLAPWFGGKVWEVDRDPTRVFRFMDLKFGGCRGIPYIEGEWSDELHLPDFDASMRQVPDDIDVLLTHCPPATILDKGPHGIGYGSQAVASYINRRVLSGRRPLKAHLFGHVHSSLGITEVGGTIFSNAATDFNVLEIG